MRLHAILAATAAVAASAQPQLINLNATLLEFTRKQLAAQNPAFLEPFHSLLDGVEEYMRLPAITVTNKSFVPPDGDKRNYVSVGFYYWPCNATGPWGPPPANCDLATGLPWIDHDGYISPYVDDFDDPKISTVCEAAIALSHAYTLGGNATYAAKAASLLRTFFLDPQLGMLPNMNYAQMVPGVCTGRGTGIIDADQFTADLLDAVSLIAPSGAWSAADDAAWRAWMGAYTGWLVSSSNGRSERNTTNNHGAWYDTQLQALGLYTGNASVVESVRVPFGPRRIAGMVSADGELPQEEARTRSIHYVIFCLTPLFQVARVAQLGPEAAVDLYEYVSPVGANSSLLGALDFTIPYALGQKAWPYQNVDNTTFADPAYYAVMRQAGAALPGSGYFAIAAQLPGDHAKDEALLLWPDMSA